MSDTDRSPAAPPALDRAATLSGVAGAAVAFTAIFLSTWLAPWFSWTGNALSDLGRASVEHSWLFNWGLMVAGALGSVFVLRVALDAENRLHWAGDTVLLGATASLFAIGLFPVPHRWHNPASLSFFVLLTYGLLVYGTADVLADRTRSGLAAIWLGTLNATGWLVWAVVAALDVVHGVGPPGVAVPELVGAIALAAWVLPATRRIRREAGVATGSGGDRGETEAPADPRGDGT